MPHIHGWIFAVVSRFRFHIRHQTKHVRQCLPKKRRLNFKYRTKPRE